MSKDDCVCQHVLKIYNEDLKEHGEIKYDQHEEFTAIKWEKQQSYFEVILSDKTVLKKHDTLISSVTFLKLELLCHKDFPRICPGKWMCSVSVVAFDVEHDLVNQFLL